MKQKPRLKGAKKPKVILAEVAEDAEKRLNRAIELRQKGRLTEAKACCMDLLKQHHDYAGALYTLGMVYIDERDYGRALPCFVQAAMHSPNDFRIITNLAGVYLKLGASEMAARTYELCDRNVSEAARRLNMHRRTLQRILAKRAPR